MNEPLTTERIVHYLTQGGLAGHPSFYGRLSCLHFMECVRALDLPITQQDFITMNDYNTAPIYVRGALILLDLSTAERKALELALAEVSL